MPLHIPVAAGVTVDTYMMEGDPAVDYTSPTTEQLCPDMTKTITDMKEGDEVLIHFDCTLFEAQISGYGSIYFRAKANGTQIGHYIRQIKMKVANSWHTLSFMRAYEIPADGDYTFTITWIFDSPTNRLRNNDGLRTMTLVHIEGG